MDRQNLKKTDRRAVERALRSFYQTQDWPEFDYIVWAARPSVHNTQGGGYYRNRPPQALRLNDISSKERAKDPWQPAVRGKAYVLLNPLSLKKKSRDMSTILSQAVGVCLRVYSPIVFETPQEVHWDDEGRFHSEEGPAIIWRDGYPDCYIHGVSVSRTFMLRPPTLSMINRQNNTERRRILLERFGHDEYLKRMKAELVAEDAFGKLWKIDRSEARARAVRFRARGVPQSLRDSYAERHRWDNQGRWVPNPVYTEDHNKVIERARKHKGWDESTEDMVFVEMINSTAEPDGSFRRYFERVPPKMKTPQQAIAWQFQLKPAAYKPMVET